MDEQLIVGEIISYDNKQNNLEWRILWISWGGWVLLIGIEKIEYDNLKEYMLNL